MNAATNNKGGKAIAEPKLRFPEFKDEAGWEAEALGNLVTISSERVGSNECIPMSITSGVGLVSQMEKFGRVIAGDSYKTYLLLKKNDFAYNKSATKEFPEGFIALYSGEQLGAVPNSIFTCFRVNGASPLPSYLNYLFLGNLHGRWLRKFIEVGARAHGSLSVDERDLLALPVPVPGGKRSVSEQQKIAECLGSLDELIGAEREKLDALKAWKKGLMQQLFPREGETVPRLRFPEFQGSGGWEPHRLEEIGEFVRDRIPVSDVNYTNYVSTENLLPDFGGLSIASSIPSAGTVICYQRNDILAANIRPYLKKVWLSDQNGGASNDVIVIRAKPDIDHLYLSQVLKNDRFIAYVMSGAKGLKMPRGDVDLIREYSVPVPPLNEQHVIASCLTLLDNLISDQRDRLDDLQSHKQALMQQLFPSPLESQA